jgi:hypothetical protein
VTPALPATLEELRRMLATADGLLRTGLGKTIGEANATLGEINKTPEELRGPIATADRVLKNADSTLVGQDAPAQGDLRQALREVTLAARALRGLMDYRAPPGGADPRQDPAESLMPHPAALAEYNSALAMWLRATGRVR